VLEAPYLNHLKTAIAKGRILPVVGAGVSMFSTDGAPTSTWLGLLKSGIEYCVDADPVLASNWRTEQAQFLDQGDLTAVGETITTTLRTMGEDRFYDWLNGTVGSLRVKRDGVLRVLPRLGTLVATTNYDSLIEQVIGGPAITWRDRSRMHQTLLGDDSGVLHFHGYFEDVTSIVLGVKSYEAITSDDHFKAMIRSLAVYKSFLFIGFGVGLADPNFSTLRQWLGKWAAYSPYGHFRLVRNQELESAQQAHSHDERLIAVPYGERYEDLPIFLEGLAESSRSNKVLAPVPARWRNVEILRYGLISENPALINSLLADMAEALVRVFGSTPENFTLLYRRDQALRLGATISYLELFCHKAQFLNAVREISTALLLEMQELKSRSVGIEERQAFKNRKFDEHSRIFNGWNVTWDFKPSEMFQALRVDYKPQVKTIRLQTEEAYSLDPASYRDQVRTSSELWIYIASYYNMLFAMSTLDPLFDNPALVNLTIDILDRRPIDIGQLRINALDNEQWLYINIPFSEETGELLQV
jgi:hypothetical protein